MEILEAVEIPLRSESLSVILDSTRYRVTLPDGLAPDLRTKADTFIRMESFPHRRVKKGKSTEFDLRLELLELSATGNSLEMQVRRGKPLEFTSAITGLPEESLYGVRVEKLEVRFRENISVDPAKTCVGN
jgi:hypothetical protein